MAARVQQQLEDMVPELRKLKELQIFNDEEVREIVKRRRKYEYMVISTDSVFARNSYREYISYELELDRLLQQRLRKTPTLSNRSNVADRVYSDKGSVPIRVTVRRRIHRIFKRCLTRFVTLIDLWKEYCAFCYRIKAFGVMNRVIMEALAKNPTCEPLWRIATKYTLTLKGSIAAKNVVQMALRANPKSLGLFTLLLELEVQSTLKLFQYSQEPGGGSSSHGDGEEQKVVVEQPEISAKTWTIIVRHAINALQSADVFKMLFFAASVCARVHQSKGFSKALKDYGEFSSMVFEEMFHRRQQHPLLGLYVWQHRLLESLLIHQHKGSQEVEVEVEVVSSPDLVFSEIMEDCKTNHVMMPVVSQFIVSVILNKSENIKKEDTATATATATDATTTAESIWTMDVEGSVSGTATETVTKKDGVVIFETSEEPDDDMDRYCENVECLKDVCFLRPISPSFDSVNQACTYTKGMINRNSLVILRDMYRSFILGKVKKTVTTIIAVVVDGGGGGSSSGGDVGDALLSNNDDELLSFIMLQIAVPGALIYSTSGYRLAMELARHLNDGDGSLEAFVNILKNSLLHSIANPDLSEAEKAKMVSLIVQSACINMVTKLEVTRKNFVNLTQHQLMSAVDSAVKSTADDISMIELVLSLMSASANVLVDDFINGSEVVNRIFTTIILRRTPGDVVVETLHKYKTNKLGLRNFGLLSVVVSLWQVHCKMEKLNSEIKQTECSEFLNDNCEAMSKLYAAAAREVIDLCETAVNASSAVSFTDNGKKVAFKNCCWNRYLRCAKDLEQLDLIIPIFNLHTFNISSDAVAARAYAQLGKNFVVNAE